MDLRHAVAVGMFSAATLLLLLPGCAKHEEAPAPILEPPVPVELPAPSHESDRTGTVEGLAEKSAREPPPGAEKPKNELNGTEPD
jgi:hypothetical protein